MSTKRQNATSVLHKLKRQRIRSSALGPWCRGKTTNVETIELINALKQQAVHLNSDKKPNQWINSIPLAIWEHKLLGSFLGLKDITVLRRTSNFFQQYWLHVFQKVVSGKQPIKVEVNDGGDCQLLQHALTLAKHFSKLRQLLNTCSEDTIVIQLGDGIHQVVDKYCNRLSIYSDNLTITGQGINKSKLLGGICVFNHNNVRLKNISITNPDGYGLQVRGYHGRTTSVHIEDCVIEHCSTRGIEVSEHVKVVVSNCTITNNDDSGMFVSGNVEHVQLNDCHIHHNKNGLVVAEDAVVHVHGVSTSVHHNKNAGIRATNGGRVSLHVNNDHLTSTNNGVHRFSRYQYHGSVDDGTTNYVEDYDGSIYYAK